MKRRNLTVLFAVAALTASAQSKLDIQSRMRLQDLKEQVETAARQKGVNAKAMEAQKNIEVFVRMTDGADAAALRDKGFNVEASRAEFAVVSLPVSRIMELNDIADVKSMSYGRMFKKKLTEANKQTGVDDVHSGKDLKTPFTGKGVLIGDIDSGFEINHPMFRDSEGKSRFSYFYDGSTAYTTPEQIAAYTTDQSDDTHATHVMGIAGGKYESDTYSISGVATDADLAGVSVMGSDTEIMKAIESLVAYSKTKNEPLVINMSLGDNCGPHDDSDQMTQYINKVIADKDATICIAAGNEGTYPIAQKKTFSSASDEMTAYLLNLDLLYGSSYESPSVYIKSEKPFSLSLVFYNSMTKKIIKQYDPITGPALKTLQSSGLKVDADFAQYFSGTLAMYSDNTGKDGSYYFELSSQKLTRRNSNVYIGYLITGEEGQSVMAYSDETTFLVKDIVNSYYGMPNYTAADGVTGDGTISNMASGTNAVIVGSFNSRDAGRYANNKQYSLLTTAGETNSLGDISSFSSWGTVDGVSMPDIAAPGCLVESAISSYYEKSQRADYTKGIYDSTTGKTYYWTVEMGTSMATPYMSGVAALWLEADPTLTNQDIKDIAKKTANKDSYVRGTKNPVQFGAGKIDAYNGLKYVLDRNATALKSISADKDMMFRQTGDNTYEAYVAGETAITVRLYDMNGRLAGETRCAGSTANFSTSGLAKGIYAVDLCGAKTSHRLKIAVK